MIARLLFILLAFFSSHLFLQEEESWVIDDIRITGLQRVSAGSVFAVMPVGLGDLISAEKFKEIANNTKMVDNITPKIANEIMIIIVIKMRPINCFKDSGNDLNLFE